MNMSVLFILSQEKMNLTIQKAASIKPDMEAEKQDEKMYSKCMACVWQMYSKLFFYGDTEILGLA